jgi:hypothetical protein
MTLRVEHGDSREVLKALPDASVDSCVCDPPYGLKFMGRWWDGEDTVAFSPDFWREVFRVLKPGAHLVAMSGTRTYHRLASAIEDAGFEIRDQLAWMYGSGFPKSHDVSKAIDKAAGEWRGRAGSPTRAGSSFGQEYERADKGDPITDSARAWEGWGTAIKPAWEPICLARKPLIGTVAANVTKFGTGALNIDGCRVPAEGGSPSIARRAAGAPTSCRPGEYGHTIVNRITPERYEEARPGVALGRWPANVLLSWPEDEYQLHPDATPEQRKALFRWLSENA